jgi:tetratricopeptide (TPR) repeat protein
MKHLITRTAGLALAFGIFFGSACTQFAVTEKPSEPDSSEQTFEQKLEQLDRQISQNPENDSLIVEKAQLLLNRAENVSDPEDREPYYRSIRDLHLNYIYADESLPSGLESLLVRGWNQENRSGLRLLQEDGSETVRMNYPKAVNHFENAITILPDSISTLFLLSTTHYKMGNLTSAIETLDQAGDLNEEDQRRLREKLAYLYLESGDFEEAIRRYQSLVEQYPEDDHYRHGLINAMIIKRDHNGAIELLEELQSEYPNRVSYRQSLASEYYFRFEQSAEMITDSKGESPVTLDMQRFQNLVQDLQRADTLYQNLRTVLPTNRENLYTMASFYTNAAYSLDDLNNQFNIPNDADLNEYREQYLNKALPLWEQLADLSPDNTEFLSQLYHVYVALDMSDKANALEQSLNLNTDL